MFDLDNYLYHNGCNRKLLKEDIAALDKLVSNSQFIIDGTYTSTLSYRVDKIDLFILTSSNKWVCLIKFLNDRHKIQNLRQSLSEMQGFDWENSKGIGTVLGFNNLRALDFDFGYQKPSIIQKHTH
ncbi:hypothetical protein ES705_10934 [subsurface metagenome]